MLAPILLLPLIASAPTPATATPNLRGVSPTKRPLYPSSSTGTWKCLNGSKTISVSAINDDYCDCEDGSDEPGTSACPSGTFYCVNAGHIGADIRSSRIGDGLCEPECCDGSDEAPGVCPNKCEEIGTKYRAEQEAIIKMRKTGSKIRSTYIDFANKEKIRLEKEIEDMRKEVEAKKKEAERAQGILESLEAMDAAALEIKKQSPLYSSLQQHNAAIKALDARSRRFQQTINELQDLLNELELGYNPNYVDTAVMNTVKAWRQMKGEAEEEQEPEKEGDTSSAGAKPPVPSDTPEDADMPDELSEEEKEDALWTDTEISKLTEKTDYVSLMLQHEKHVVEATGADQVKSMLYSIRDYLPDALLPTYETTKKALVDTLITMGVLPKPADNSEELSRARQTKSEASKALSSKENDLRNAEDARKKLFDPTWYGKQGEWRKLKDICLEKDTGEYTYSVCLFGQATQKANRGGMSNNLGSFISWSKTLTPGESAYYEMMHYERGAQCWNGPQRSVTLKLSCGVENELLSVTEPNKCEYHIIGKTPALCSPVDQDASKEQKDEL